MPRHALRVLFATLALLLALMPLVPRPAQAGVIIGNPPQVRWSISAATGGGESFTGSVAWVELRARDGTRAVAPGASNVEFAAGWQPLFPAGDWVHLTLVFDGPLTSCTPLGCHSVQAVGVDLDAPVPDDQTLRGVIIGNPPRVAARVR